MAATATVPDVRFPGGQTLAQWAAALLTDLGDTVASIGAPAFAADQTGLETWANHESGGYNPKVAGGKNNPLNTTEGALGFSGQGGKQGNIKDYATFQQGVDAQAYNLEHTQGAGYSQILGALRTGSTQNLFAAVDASKFGTHGLTTGSGVGTGPGAGTSSSTTAASLTGFDFNPLNWWGDLTSGAENGVAKVGVTLAVLGMGLTLIVLGAWKSVSPNVKQTLTSAGKAAAVA